MFIIEHHGIDDTNMQLLSKANMAPMIHAGNTLEVEGLGLLRQHAVGWD